MIGTHGNATPSTARPLPALNCGGAQLRARCRQRAITITIAGDIDDMNLDGVAAHTTGFALPETAVVLDLAGVDSFSARGITLLRRVDQTCDALGIPWCLLPSATVTEQLRTARAHHHFPIADSVPHALVSFTENIEPAAA
jgi:anti-anti-sigma regulatory factor